MAPHHKNSHRSPGSRTAGFTLIEVMLALGLLSAVVYMTSVVVFLHTKTYFERLADIDTDQAAQTIINMLQTSTQKAGYGFGHGPSAMGPAVVGQCGDGSPPDPFAPARTNCTARDNDGKNDRLRIAYIDPWALFYSHARTPSAGPCPGGSGSDPHILHIPPGSNTMYTSNTPAFTGGIGVNIFIGGKCSKTGPQALFGTTELTPLNGANPGDGCSELRSFATTPPDASQALVCSEGFEPGWTMGISETLDFFSARDPVTGLMTLYVNQKSWGPNLWAVAQGVSRFEVRYALDLDESPTGKIGVCPTCADDPFDGTLGRRYAWCRDLRTPSGGGSCALSTSASRPIGDEEIYNRVVAMHVTFDITRAVRPGGYLGTIMNATQKTNSYEALFLLRNMQPS